RPRAKTISVPLGSNEQIFTSCLMSKVVMHRLHLRLRHRWRVAPHHSYSNVVAAIYGVSHIGDMLSRGANGMSQQSIRQSMSAVVSASPDSTRKAPRHCSTAALAVSNGIPTVAANGPPLCVRL